MKLIYTHENRLLVELARSKLQAAGITVFLKNEFAQGGAGDLAPTQAWLELWLERERDYPRACEVLKDSGAGGALWHCKDCGEENGAAFDFCWQCQQSRPGNSY